MKEFGENESYGQEDDRERVNSTQKQDLSTGQTGDDRDPNQETRPKRVPMKQGTNLGFEDCDMDPTQYRYYVFNEDPNKPGRIDRAKGAAWEHVTNRQGQVATRASGGGTAYLMRLPMEYAKEDNDAKRAKVLATMADAGKMGRNEYAPDPETGRAEGGASIHQGSHTSDNPYS
jgi:hypothetical protein